MTILPIFARSPRTLKLSAALFAGVLMSACATGPQLAKAGAYETPSYTVNLPSDWNAITFRTNKNKKNTVLTKDGPALNAVYLISDLQPGDALLKEWRRDNPVPKFSTDLFDLELVDFLTDSFQRGLGTSLTAKNIRPAEFKGEDAIRFDLTGRQSDGLDMSGQAIMAVIAGKLNIILFLAPSEYYADKDKRDIDAIFNSVTGEALIAALRARARQT